jgi:hypothetical protein
LARSVIAREPLAKLQNPANRSQRNKVGSESCGAIKERNPKLRIKLGIGVNNDS